jgi:hypothetical protein
MAEIDFSLSQDLLHELFEYRDGKLFWKKVTSHRVDVIGKEVGCVNSYGYRVTKLHGKNYFVHRLIYAMFHGEVPSVLDHIDGNTANNQIENLRPATMLQNSYNQKNYKNNTTGVKGVNFNKQCGKFSARCQVNKKQNWLGFFPTLELAEEAVKAFRTEHHGEFANHG